MSSSSILIGKVKPISSLVDTTFDTCSECLSKDIWEDTLSGCVVCRSCGLQLSTTLITQDQEWRDFNDDDTGGHSFNKSTKSRVSGTQDNEVYGLSTIVSETGRPDGSRNIYNLQSNGDENTLPVSKIGKLNQYIEQYCHTVMISSDVILQHIKTTSSEFLHKKYPEGHKIASDKNIQVLSIACIHLVYNMYHKERPYSLHRLFRVLFPDINSKQEKKMVKILYRRVKECTLKQYLQDTTPLETQEDQVSSHSIITVETHMSHLLSSLRLNDVLRQPTSMCWKKVQDIGFLQEEKSLSIACGILYWCVENYITLENKQKYGNILKNITLVNPGISELTIKKIYNKLQKHRHQLVYSWVNLG
jgi:transcription initiation factor TFIIIB Brf1 subunit/transcription initiation factor TFIIB